MYISKRAGEVPLEDELAEAGGHWRLAVTIDSDSPIMLNRRSTSATIRVCSAGGWEPDDDLADAVLADAPYRVLNPRYQSLDFTAPEAGPQQTHRIQSGLTFEDLPFAVEKRRRHAFLAAALAMDDLIPAEAVVLIGVQLQRMAAFLLPIWPPDSQPVRG